MKKEWYITFHGGEERSELNNIHVYSGEGGKVRKALDQDRVPKRIELRELRGFAFGPDGHLYVANAFKNYSEILRFKGQLDRNHQHDFLDVFVENDAVDNPGLIHPFSVAFDSFGDLYVTSQGANLTLRYHGPNSTHGAPGTPMPLPAALKNEHGKRFAPGTFCPSAAESAEGLVVVREAVFTNDLLYVSDRDADCVRKYDRVSGAYRGCISAKGLIDKPIQLAVTDGILYIGNRGNESVVKCDLRSESVSPFILEKAGGLNNPAGLAFSEDGWFYVASRSSRQILRYRLADGSPDRRPFIDGLQDDPEFLELVTRSDA